VSIETSSAAPPGTPVASNGSAGAGDGLERTTRLADALERLIHLMHRTRTQLLHQTGQEEWSAQVLMSALVHDGPQRVKALAELVQSDPSTVSRQAAHLVRQGFVERRVDTVDGRASVLVATQKAHDTVADRKHLRDQHIQQMLHDWQTADCDQLADLIVRFSHDFETYKTTALTDTDWTQIGSTSREETRS
jgi:DNA-binding MarR family transcriptional regulator